ncbi:MAG: efflux RND transporter periplasmic adaptor subunit [Azonexus sp.]|nr:efflux RND transporter periplasmic adaptor subunit [Azonexus sp.]
MRGKRTGRQPETATLVASDFADELSAVGSLKAAESVVLRPETSGRVVSIGFRDGEVVSKGALLLALDTTVQDAELAQARANLALTQSSYRRNQELLEKKFISPQALEASGAALAVQQAAVQLAEAKAAKMRLRAPFRGMVGLRELSVGTYVKEGETLITVDDIASLRVDFRLPESALGRLARGQVVSLSSDALPGEAFTARVEALDPQLDPNGRSIAVRARLDNPGGRLRPGMFVRVRMVLGERKQVVMLPEAAVIPGQKPSVYTVVDGKVVPVSVRLGVRRDAQVEVLEGVQAGAVVVTAGQMKLKPGAAVTTAAPAAPVGMAASK